MRSEAPGWFFQQLICGGVLPPPAVPLGYARGQGFPPLIRCEKTAPSHQSLQKSPPVPVRAPVEAAAFYLPPMFSRRYVTRKLCHRGEFIKTS